MSYEPIDTTAGETLKNAFDKCNRNFAATSATREVEKISDLPGLSADGSGTILVTETGANYAPVNDATNQDGWSKVASSDVGWSWALVVDDHVNAKWAEIVPDFDTTAQTGTDNLARFQELLNFCAAGSYRRIFIPSGNYLLSGELKLWDSPTDDANETALSNDDWQIVGENPWRTILFFDGATNNGLRIRGKNVLLKNLRINSTTARATAKGTIAQEDQGNGIYINNASIAATQTRITLDYVVVYDQPQDGLRAQAMELMYCQTCDFNQNGRHGIHISDRNNIESVWNYLVNARASDNAGDGILISNCTYNTLDNPQGYRNAGYAQINIDGGRSNLIENPDVEMHSNKVVVDKSFTNLTFDGTLSKIVRSAGSFITDGYTTNEKLAVIGSKTNDRYYSIVNVTALEITVGNFTVLDADENGNSVQLVSNTNSSGLRLSGKIHKSVGGHATSLNAGAEIRSGESCRVENLHTISSLSGYNMPVGVIVDENSIDCEVITPNYFLQNLENRYFDIGGTRNIHTTGNQRNDRLILQAVDMYAVTGLPVMTVLASRQQAWLLDPDDPEYMSVVFKLPTGWYNKVKLTAYYANPTGAAAGNVNFTAVYEPRAPGDDLNTSGTTVITTAPIGAAQNILEKAEFSELITLDTSKEIQAVRFGRNGFLSADTFLGDLALCWVTLEHVID